MSVTSGLWGDCRLAIRRLRATPLFLVFAVGSLALGLGLTITSYAVLEALVWAPLGLDDPDRVAVVTEPGGAGDRGIPAAVAREDFDELRRAVRTVTPVAASARFSQTLVTPSGSAMLAGEAVSGDYFAVMGVGAAIGRTIQPIDDARAEPVVVLSDMVWRSRFAADPGIVGRTVRLGGHLFEVVGVAERRFHGRDRYVAAGAWVPLQTAARFRAERASSEPARVRIDLSVLGRVASDQSIQSARAEIVTIGQALDRTHPIPAAGPAGDLGIPRRWSAQPIEVLRRPADDQALLLLFIIAMVLVVACTNLANLLLARGTMRHHEIAVRRALGASRWRLVRELSVESAIVAVLGAAAALGATHWLLLQIPRDMPGLGFSFPIEPTVNLSTLAVAGGALLLSLFTFGVEPAIQLTRKPVTQDLASESGTGDRRRMLRHRQLIRWQVAISACFFLIVSLAGRLLLELVRHDPGIELEGLAVATVRGTDGWEESRVRRAVEDALAAARRESGIEAVAMSVGLPFGINAALTPVTTPDRPFLDTPLAMGNQPRMMFIPATSGVFRTLGIPILEGRGFEARDDASAAPVAIVNDRAARKLFGTRDVVGRQVMFRHQRETRIGTVVGVAADTDTSMMFGSRQSILYVPFFQHYLPGQLTMTARAANAADAARVLQAAIRNADPDLSPASYGEARVLLTWPFFQIQILAAGAAALGLLTLILGMVGLYGVQSQTVTHRTREVGVRLALGATARQIDRMMLKSGFVPVVQGIVLGLAFGSLIRLVFRVTLDAPIDIVDPLALILVPVPVVIAAFLACRVPAYRASRVDPKVALRHL